MSNVPLKFKVPGDIIQDQNFHVFSSLRSKPVITHPISIQDINFEEKTKNESFVECRGKVKPHLKIPPSRWLQISWQISREQPAASLSGSLLIPRPAAGRLTTSGGLGKARRSSGEEKWGGPGGETEVGNPRPGRPTANGIWIVGISMFNHPQMRLRKETIFSEKKPYLVLSFIPFVDYQ